MSRNTGNCHESGARLGTIKDCACYDYGLYVIRQDGINPSLGVSRRMENVMAPIIVGTENSDLIEIACGGGKKPVSRSLFSGQQS